MIKNSIVLGYQINNAANGNLLILSLEHFKLLLNYSSNHIALSNNIIIPEDELCNERKDGRETV